jgi:hypothetical protein
VVMRSPCAGAALDPPLLTTVPNKALSLSLSLSLTWKCDDLQQWFWCSLKKQINLFGSWKDWVTQQRVAYCTARPILLGKVGVRR